MYLLVLSVDTAVAEGRLQRVAYQVTTLSSEPLDPLYKNRYVLPFTVRAEPGKTISVSRMFTLADHRR